jgi:hypothetical protein
VDVDHRDAALTAVLCVVQVSRDQLHVMEVDVHGRLGVEGAEVDLAVAHRHAIDAEGEEILDGVAPVDAGARLTLLLGRARHEVELGPQELDLADERTVEERAPLDREVGVLGREERDRHLAVALVDPHVLDLVGAADQRHVDIADMADVGLVAREHAIHVALDRDRKDGARHDQEHDRNQQRERNAAASHRRGLRAPS